MADNWTEYKVVILGIGSAGKSAMTVKFMSGVFIEKYDPTIEDCYRKEMEVGGTAIALDILDTSGQEEYSALRDLYIRRSNTFLLVYSIVSENSWEYVRKIQAVLLERKKGNLSIVLAGNKCDLESERVIDSKDVDAFILEHNVKYHNLTSAKTGFGIQEVFENIAKTIIDWRIKHPHKRTKKNCVLQ